MDKSQILVFYKSDYILIMALDNYFYKVRRYHPNILTNVGRVLLNAKCTTPDHTMTLAQIRGKFQAQNIIGKLIVLSLSLLFLAAAYRELTDDKFPSMGDPRVEMCFLLSMPHIACFSNKHGTFHFYIIRENEPK